MFLGSIIQYPDGTDIVVNLLRRFPALTIRQARVFLMQTDHTFNSQRTSELIRELIKRNVLVLNGNKISLAANNKSDDDAVIAFWVFLQFAEPGVKFERGMYPSEIVFMKDNTVNEIIVCNDDFLEKMDFLSKRVKRKNKCHYYIVLQSDTISEVDDSLFPDTSFTIVTMSYEGKNDIPKLMYHQIFSEENKSIGKSSFPQDENDAGEENSSNESNEENEVETETENASSEDEHEQEEMKTVSEKRSSRGRGRKRSRTNSDDQNNNNDDDESDDDEEDPSYEESTGDLDPGNGDEDDEEIILEDEDE